LSYKLNKITAALLLSALGVSSMARGEEAGSAAIIDRVGDTGFLRVDVKGFDGLDARQQQLAYWLAQAAIAIDPIAYDQFSRFGLRQKRLLEGIVAFAGADPANRKVVDFAKLFWANRGNHNESTSQKILPTFTFAELSQAAHTARHRGAFVTAVATLPPLLTEARLDRELKELRASIFDPDFEPMLTSKTPPAGRDILQASSNTFYQNVSLKDLPGFTEANPLNSRLVKTADGTLHEEVYRAGTRDGRVPPGLYAPFLRRANEYLAKAQTVAEPAQAKAIGDLITYYQTGRFADWLQFDTDWVQNDAIVDFSNGFVEIYRDARGAKGSAAAFVSISDRPLSELMSRLCDNADYFERQAPWDASYRRQTFKRPVIKAVENVIETADFAVTTIGDDLPNENVIHDQYGSKNFVLVNITRAYNQSTGHEGFREFSDDAEVTARNERYGDEAGDLLTSLHEVIGHGSGRVSERLTAGAEPYLKEYYSTLEEARADLMALWNTWDPKLKELGLISDQEQVSKAMYDGTVQSVLTELRLNPVGDTVEEDHERDHRLIVNFISDRVPGSIVQFDRDGKHYVKVQDYQKMRQGVGMLLAELMRIKGEGDYAAIKVLVDRYAVHFDTSLRDQIIERFRQLNQPTYWAGIFARLTVQSGPDGSVQAVHLSYPGSVDQQYLNFASMYDRSLLQAPAAF
jgi:dipeptidyl-peptidase III